MSARACLDWNATAPLRPEARTAMIAAMDVAGNPSSVHAEGRAARAVLERARAQVALALGVEGAEVVFTSGATEGAALALAGRGLAGSAIEHDCVAAWTDASLDVDAAGKVAIEDPAGSVLQSANAETGIVQELPEGLAFCDAVQVIGKMPFDFGRSRAAMAILSAHKFGGPKGAGALILRPGAEVAARLRGGGQEAGRRSGTENLTGIAGLGAAIEAAARDVADGLWQGVAELRDMLEEAVASIAPEAVIPGQGATRLPNTSCIVVPGWKGETQVMQMDLAGFAISAGSACSSGKVRASKVLQAMGFDGLTASSAIRVSLGPQTTSDQVMAFAGAWEKQYRRFRQQRAA